MEFDRLIGAVVIVIGLYSLIWGKGSDHVNLSMENNGEKQGKLELPRTSNGAMMLNSDDDATILDIPALKKPGLK